MKTISIQNDAIGVMNNSQTLLASSGNWALRSPGSVATWLPVPPTPYPQVVHRKATSAPSSNIWISLPYEPIAEKLMLGLLMLAALVGIGYGFSCLLDLVQNWASVHTTLGLMIQ